MALATSLKNNDMSHGPLRPYVSGSNLLHFYILQQGEKMGLQRRIVLLERGLGRGAWEDSLETGAGLGLQTT